MHLSLLAQQRPPVALLFCQLLMLGWSLLLVYSNPERLDTARGLMLL